MRGLAPRSLAALAALVASLALAAPAAAAPHFEGSFKVSATGANNLKMAEGPDGNVWMTLEGSAKDVARITPAGLVTEIEFAGAVEKPSGIAAGPDGAMWVTTEKGVARFTTDDPTKAVETPIAEIKGNSSIVAGPDGQMWVATEDNVVHFKPTEPAGAKPFAVTGLKPKDIDVAGSLLAIADSGASRVVTMTTAGAAKDVPFVGNELTNTSQGLAGSPDGQIAFSESDGKEGLGLVTPPSPATSVKRLGDPFGVARGSDGAYYFAMSADDNVRRLTPDGGNTAIEGFPKEFFPRQITAGAGNTMWVAMEIPGKNTVEVARIAGLEPPAPPAPPTPPVPQPGPVPPGPGPVVLPQTTLGKVPKKVVKTSGEKATVKFSFSSTSPGARFECSLGRRVKPKGKKARFVGQAFKGCKSPRSYTLAPGRYRFQVRAVAGGSRDASPAAFGFKVVRVKSG